TDKTVRVWEYPSGKELRRIGTPVASAPLALTSTFGLQGNGFPVAISPDGKVVAACYDSSSRIQFLDVATGATRDHVPLQTATRTRIKQLSFSPDGQYLAELQDNGVGHIWEWDKGKEVCTFGAPRKKKLPWPDKSVLSSVLIWSPNGKVLATYDGSIRLW